LMILSISPNTQAILLLTAPLITGHSEPSKELLRLGEYKALARFLREQQRQPADLIAPDAQPLLEKCATVVDGERIRRLLERGFLLSQAVEFWQARAIWVTSRADDTYPTLLKQRLREDAPPIIYGCGDPSLLEAGGLAVIGSREVNADLIAYTEAIGHLASSAQRTVISGGARGIDQAAMQGALESGGSVIGVLADTLAKNALNRSYRTPLMENRLALISPYDPSAGFNVGNAMQRNKLIYALADVAFVVNSDYEKGGTWAGAVEQLDKLHFVPVYVRSSGQVSPGLMALGQKGAFAWPEPNSPEELAQILDTATPTDRAQQPKLFATESQISLIPVSTTLNSNPADELFAKVRDLLSRLTTPKTEAEIAAELSVVKSQAKDWLERLVNEGSLERYKKPLRYGPKAQPRLLK
jgi:predicted Rossmann fold nucleotide-binding protein DprA/Smf involved in DNA uptake